MTDNHRQDLRLNCAQTIFIEVRGSYPPDGKTDKLIICNSVDISANGIRAVIDQPLPESAIYQLCVEIHETGRQIFLSAQVKWCRKTDAGYEVGLLIFESDDTDIEHWKHHIAWQLKNSISDDAD